MQRANASSKCNSPLSEPSAKRIRTETGYTPATSATNTPTSEKRVYFPTPAQIQTQASPVQTYQLGGVIETQWVIATPAPVSPPPFDVKSDETESEEENSARQTYGNFKRQKRTTTTNTSDNATRGAAHSIRPLSEDEADSIDGASDTDDNDSDEDEHAQSRSVTRKKKAAAMTGEDLDRIDLRNSQYTQSKGTLNPHHGSGGSSNNKKVYNKRGASMGKKDTGSGKIRRRDHARNKSKKTR